jgi:arabinose-5-phosphate isomerase
MACHAKFLNDVPSSRVTLEGNADERGTREYNLGLGERRGNAVSGALQGAGGSAAQLTVVSYGEERPVCNDTSESCWSQNRRVEIVSTAKYALGRQRILCVALVVAALAAATPIPSTAQRLSLADRIDEHFSRAVALVLACPGRVVITGMGKSGLICQKIAATMASTGTPALFLHPAEGIHGDLGMVMKGDVVIAVSNSGETEEIVRILPVIKRMGLPLVAMSGNRNSTLARAGDVFLDISVKEEACPLGLAPTASTTATLALGDALAVALLVQRGFKEEDFALFHPGGALGKRLLLRVEDLMHTGAAVPMVDFNLQLKDALFEITSKKLGITGVAAGDGSLAGVFSDGDLRRSLEQGIEVLNRPIGDVMSRNPKRILRGNLAAKAVQKMEEHSITSLFVFENDESTVPVGIIHLHDLLKAGVV